MMKRISVCAACILVPALAPGVRAQPAGCRALPEGYSNGVYQYATIGGPLADAGPVVDSVLAHYGYGAATRSRDAEEREVWTSGPNFGYVEGLDFPEAHGVRNPGLRAVVTARWYGPDSTMIEVLVGTACQGLNDDGRAETAEVFLASLNSSILADGMRDRGLALGPEGLKLDVPAGNGAPRRLRAPASAAGFVIAGRYEHEDPARGVLLRYARGPGLFLYLEVAPAGSADCDAACAADVAEAQMAAERERLVRLTESGYYAGAEVRGEEALTVPPGAPWRLARLLTADVQVRRAESRMLSYVFVHPGYKVNVYATFPRSNDLSAAVRAFVDDVLPTLAPRS